MKISLIVAMASNRAIGINGQMPWHLAADLKRFKRITMGSPVIMGRKTFEAIGRPLPGRTNIIVSRNPDYRQPGCLVYPDIAEALTRQADEEEVFVIGGASLYRACLPDADLLYLTEIDKAFAGDTYFPEIQAQLWRELERLEIENDETVDFSYRFLKLERIG